ncbi:hypothetical protein [Pilibacter termitis]|uniref:hypothetical protein n=1 Tax=Pilibacter termitis TaxID=263852 RepID=UPI0011858777|nr:hypothetical protein [Pilibacter termitis]
MALRPAVKLQPLVARQRKATKGVQGIVAVSHAVYLPEAELQVALRTATKPLPLLARHRKAKKCVLKSVAVSHVVYLLATLVAIDVVNSHQTSAPLS